MHASGHVQSIGIKQFQSNLLTTAGGAPKSASITLKYVLFKETFGNVLYKTDSFETKNTLQKFTVHAKNWIL